MNTKRPHTIWICVANCVQLFDISELGTPTNTLCKSTATQEHMIFVYVPLTVMKKGSYVTQIIQILEHTSNIVLQILLVVILPTPICTLQPIPGSESVCGWLHKCDSLADLLHCPGWLHKRCVYMMFITMLVRGVTQPNRGLFTIVLLILTLCKHIYNTIHQQAEHK